MIEPTKKPLTILLASPRGFCAGVDRAIQIVERAIERYGRPVYVRHEIVHNRYVVEASRPRARSSSTSSTRCRTTGRWCSRRTACRKRCRPRPAAATCSMSTPPARWSPRSIARPSATTIGPHRRADRPCRPSRGHRHHGPASRRRRAAGRGRGAGRSAGSARSAQSRLCHADHPVGRRHDRRSWPRCAAASRRSRARRWRTSATPPPTGRRRSRRSPRAAMRWW